MESTIDLLARIQQGDGTAVSLLMERSVPPLRRWARGRIPKSARNLADTEDIVQEAVVRVLPSLTAIEARHPGALQALLRQAVADHIDHLLEHPETETRTSFQKAALRRLAPADRQAIVARIELQQSYEEVAIALDLPDTDAARAAVTAALARLIEAMA